MIHLDLFSLLLGFCAGVGGMVSIWATVSPGITSPNPEPPEGEARGVWWG